jgi:hypothetical protein
MLVGRGELRVLGRLFDGGIAGYVGLRHRPEIRGQ